MHDRRPSQPVELVQHAVHGEVGYEVVCVLFLAVGDRRGVEREGGGFGEAIVDFSDGCGGGEDVAEAGKGKR